MIYNLKRSTKLLALTKTAVSILIFVLVLTITVGLSLHAYGRKADQVNDALISIVKIFFLPLVITKKTFFFIQKKNPPHELVNKILILDA